MKSDNNKKKTFKTIQRAGDRHPAATLCPKQVMRASRHTCYVYTHTHILRICMRPAVWRRVVVITSHTRLCDTSQWPPWRLGGYSQHCLFFFLKRLHGNRGDLTISWWPHQESRGSGLLVKFKEALHGNGGKTTRNMHGAYCGAQVRGVGTR